MPQGVVPGECVVDESDRIYRLVVCELDSIELSECDRHPGCLETVFTFVLAVVLYWNGDEMLKLKKGCAIAEILLDDGLLRMCRKYDVNPENWMKAALIDHLHSKAISNDPWGEGEWELQKYLWRNMELESELVNNLK